MATLRKDEKLKNQLILRYSRNQRSAKQEQELMREIAKQDKRQVFMN